MRLSIDDSLFVLGSAHVTKGHLIWPKECPVIWMQKLMQDQEYPGRCIVFDCGNKRYSGPAFARRRKQYGTSDMLVILLPDVDIGPLSADAIIDMEIDALT